MQVEKYTYFTGHIRVITYIRSTNNQVVILGTYEMQQSFQKESSRFQQTSSMTQRSHTTDLLRLRLVVSFSPDIYG